ncbi:cupin domain-containing protein [Dyadobacter sp. CY327]|uniref:cupin domain-containing protein n=1 Tax=Dyadobacter sp. CY327 TaxID=2907301 RepID=UPI001F34514E|nr:cupin domain-containing protein [Dyadobacter sp. CY327]MCE7072581.1 cupin domain-containing protein [Dyadobacter sp. CY327]
MDNSFSEIKNSKTGQLIRFVSRLKDTEERLGMVASYPPFCKEPPEHYHPHQTEYITILKGEIAVRINGKVCIYKEGESIITLPNDRHAMWNDTSQTVIVDWQVFPQLETETFLRKMTQLANLPETGPGRIVRLFKGMYLLLVFSDTIKLTGLPGVAINWLTILLSPFLRLKRNYNQI